MIDALASEWERLMAVQYEAVTRGEYEEALRIHTQIVGIEQRAGSR